MTVPSQMSLRRIPDALHLHGARGLRGELGSDHRHPHPSGAAVRHRVRVQDLGAGRAGSLLPRHRGAREHARSGALPDADGSRSQDHPAAHGAARPRRVGPAASRPRPGAQALSPPLSRADAGAGPDGGRAGGGGRRRHARRERAGAGLAAQGRDGGATPRPTTTCASSDSRRAWRRWSCSGCRRGWRPTSSTAQVRRAAACRYSRSSRLRTRPPRLPNRPTDGV